MNISNMNSWDRLQQSTSTPAEGSRYIKWTNVSSVVPKDLLLFFFRSWTNWTNIMLAFLPSDWMGWGSRRATKFPFFFKTACHCAVRSQGSYWTINHSVNRYIEQTFFMNWSALFDTLKRPSSHHRLTLAIFFFLFGYYPIHVVSIRYSKLLNQLGKKFHIHHVPRHHVQLHVDAVATVWLINWLNICLLCVPLAITEALLMENEFFETTTK